MSVNLLVSTYLGGQQNPFGVLRQSHDSANVQQYHSTSDCWFTSLPTTNRRARYIRYGQAQTVPRLCSYPLLHSRNGERIYISSFKKSLYQFNKKTRLSMLRNEWKSWQIYPNCVIIHTVESFKLTCKGFHSALHQHCGNDYKSRQTLVNHRWACYRLTLCLYYITKHRTCQGKKPEISAICSICIVSFSLFVLFDRCSW